jgi:hypothetical protein
LENPQEEGLLLSPSWVLVVQTIQLPSEVEVVQVLLGEAIPYFLLLLLLVVVEVEETLLLLKLVVLVAVVDLLLSFLLVQTARQGKDLLEVAQHPLMRGLLVVAELVAQEYEILIAPSFLVELG